MATIIIITQKGRARVEIRKIRASDPIDSTISDRYFARSRNLKYSASGDTPLMALRNLLDEAGVDIQAV